MKNPVFDIDNWKEIGATLSRNKTRTFLTGFGIFWGVAILAILMGGARGGTDLMRRQFSGMATNTAFLIPGQTTMPYKSTPKGRRIKLNLLDLERLRQNIPELKLVLPVYGGPDVSCRNGKYSYSVGCQGVDAGHDEIVTPIIYSGRFINEADVSQQRKVACVGKKVANEIFPGDPDPTGKTFQINNVTYTVVGVVGSMSDVNINGPMDEAVILPSSTFRGAFARGDRVDFIAVLGQDNVVMKDMIPKITSVIARRHNANPGDQGILWVINAAEMFAMADNLFTGLNLLALFIGFSTLMAGVIGIGNIMWIIVKERTQEIGVRRAIGAKPRDIIAQVLSEGVALTVVFGMVGILLATLVLGIAQHVANEGAPLVVANFQMSFGRAVGIVVMFVVLGTLAGLLPSIKAMKIKPVEAMNSKLFLVFGFWSLDNKLN